ncbi:MAG TPA: ABC transporter permease [Pyrinomonadaceae bacterium]|jgi:ribose/xylose/arabinose/galactoside ABC-type transport system permease subunit
MSATTINEADRRRSALGRLIALGPTYGALIALILLVLFNAVFTRNFATASNLWNILQLVSTTVLVAIGMTLVIATRGIDLSVGSVMAIASALAATSLEMGVAVAVLLALAAAFAVGAFNGALVSGFRIQPIIVTLAVLITGRGAAQVLSRGGQLIPFNNPAFEFLGKGYIGPVPVQVLLMLLIIAAAIFVMRATSFGRYVMAVGGNEAAARLAGIKVHRTKIIVYAISGLLAGLAGLIETARLGASDAAKVGLYIELDAIAAVVVGGTPLTGGRATIIGTVIGALIMQVITTSFNMRGIPYSWSLVLKAAIILIAVYIQRPKVA